MTRRERHEQVKALKDAGLTFKEIAARIGVCQSTVTAAYYDPTGEKDRARKARYSRPCVDCGKPLNGSDGNSPNAPIRCIKCASIKSGADRKIWTRDTIIAAIREWASIHGEHPRVGDWNPTHARNIGRAVHPDYVNEPERWPCQHTVMREFGQPGGWARAMREAGFTPRTHGETDATLAAPAARREALRMAREGLSTAEIARRQGVTWNCARDRIRRAA